MSLRKGGIKMNFYEFFAQYIGIQGLLAFGLVGAYIGASLASIVLPDGFTEIMTLVCGFYFAKNGKNMVDTVKGK